jgi:hypothetical protein
MADKITGTRPGDAILDRYMPNATREEREEARENLRKLVRILLAVFERAAREEMPADSTEIRS